jgi:hypothetical protein
MKGTGDISEFGAAKPALKKYVSFKKLNLTEHAKVRKVGTFDIILARNVLIYFSEQDVVEIVKSLSNNLSPESLFISGLSEPIRFSGWDLKAIGPSCYQKSTAKVMKIEREPMTHSISAVSHKKYRILCVDDSLTIQKLMKKHFLL